MRLQKGFVHFENRDLREGQTRTWRRGRERARQREKSRRRESRRLGATKHVLRRDENGRGWPGPAVARVAPPQCVRVRSFHHGGSWARTISESKKFIFVFFVCVSACVCVCVCVCLLVCLCVWSQSLGETPVEVRGDTDGQIVRCTWRKGRRTDRTIQ